MKRTILLLLLCVAGILFRLWFIQIAPQPFVDDQTEYEWYAAKIFLDPHLLASFSFRPYPYSLFLAIVYKIVGFGNHYAIYVLQACIDVITAYMVYAILKIAVRSKVASWIGFILYLINPFTSGYVGVILTEVHSAFFITATILTGLLFIQKSIVLRGVLFGLAAGFAAETRNAAFLWAGIPIVLIFGHVQWKKYLVSIVAIFLGVFLTVLYPLYVNYRDYKEINVTTVDSIFARELWNGIIFRTLPPLTKNLQIPELEQMYREYYSERNPGRTTQDRKAMGKKYMTKALALIAADPIDYIKMRFYKMWYVWQKENVFFYEEPNWENRRVTIYIVNLILLVLTVIGLVVSWSGSTPVAKWLWWSMVGTIVYGTLVFSITHAEYRLTIPFYPILIIASSLAITRLVHEAPSTLRSRYLLPTLRLPAGKAGRKRNPSEAKRYSLSSTGLRPRYFAKGDNK